MLSEAEKAERAEFIQSVKALFIPSSLFLACVIMAAGSFLIYNHESVGWLFVAVSLATVAGAFYCLIRFQNTYRAKGIIKDQPQPEPDATLEFAPDQSLSADMQAQTPEAADAASAVSSAAATAAGRNQI